MPSLFGKKKPSTQSRKQSGQSQEAISQQRNDSNITASSEQLRAPSSSPEKKSRATLSKDRDRENRPRSTRGSGSSKNIFQSKPSRKVSDTHPLNLPPEELKRLSALSAGDMSSATGDSSPHGDPMVESTPPPTAPGSFPNGMEGVESTQDTQNAASPSPAESESPPVDAEACKEAGNKYYKAKQYDQAIEEYTKAIDADPKSATYLSNRAAAFMAANQYGMALDDCKQAEDLEPDNVKILQRLAKIYTSLGRPQEALLALDRIQPPVSAKDRQPAVSMLSHVQQAEESLQSGTSGSLAIHALDMAERGLGYTVQVPRKWKLLRGEAYLKMGSENNLGEAQNVAMSLLRANGADPDALVLRGRALYAQGENEKAIQHFRQAIQCDPDYKDAIKYLRLVRELDKMKEEGNAHFKAGRYQQAVDIYTSALEVDPLNKGTNSKILNNRAMCYTKLNDFSAAIQDADKAIQLDPAYTKAKKTRAKALGESGDWEEAVRAYKSIEEQSPNDPTIAKDIRNAELELKKSKRKDYYKILGIGKDATDTEIKKAYRKLAVVHHPDKNPGDQDAEDRFKEIQEAHETLIDPQKRQRYDSGVDLMEPGEGFGGFPGGMGGMGGAGGMQIDPEMLFNMFGGGGRGGGGFSFSSGGPGMGGGHPFGGRGGFSPF